MVFPLIIMVVALMMEVIGSIISIIGLASSLGGSLLVICMVIIVDIAKIVGISAIIQYYKSLPKILVGLSTLICICLVSFTSYGIFGFLSSEFNKTITPNIKYNHELNLLENRKNNLNDELNNYKNRLTIINDKLNDDKISNKFFYHYSNEKKEVEIKYNTILNDIEKIDNKLLYHKTENKHQDSHAIIAEMIATWFSVPLEQSMKYVIIAFTIIFDSFAIIMLIIANLKIKEYKNKEDDVVIIKPKQNITLSTSYGNTSYMSPLPEKVKRPYKKRQKKIELDIEQEEYKESKDDEVQIIESSLTKIKPVGGGKTFKSPDDNIRTNYAE